MSRLLNQPVRNRILASLTALTFTALLAGCSNDDDAPELNESSEVTDAATTEYIPASADGPAQNVPEPNLPAVATENTEEGAEATLQYFWEAEVFASLTGTTRPLALVSAENCGFCHESIEEWHDYYEAGTWTVHNGDLEISVSQIDTAIDAATQKPVAHIYFELEEPPTDFYRSAGEQTDGSFDTPSQTDWFALLFYDSTAQRWEIDWLGLEESVEWED